MITFTRFLAPLAILCGGLANGQLATNLRLSKNQYLAGEGVVATVTITNHSGREIDFQGFLGRPWLDFIVTNNRGDATVPTGAGMFGRVKLGVGQTLTRRVDLATMFQLGDPGNYSASATVRMPGLDNDSTVSNRELFTVIPGRSQWSQKVGTAHGKVREFRVMELSGDKNTELYAQVVDGRSGLPVRTFSLGEVLLVRKPSYTVDKLRRLHVLFLNTPSTWVHCQVDTDGRMVSRQIHLRGQRGDPSLLISPTGDVTVINSVLYDPKAAAARRAKFRKLSERPAITY